jgi:Kef-type K+ transport system membrane component KefB
MIVTSIISSGSMRSGSFNDVFKTLSGVVLYLIIYLGFASAFGRFANRTAATIRPNHVRVITVLLFAIGCVIPMIAKAMEFLRWRDYSLFEIINPFATVIELADDDSWTGPILLILGFFASIAMLLNLKAMILGIHEIVSLKPESQNEEVTVAPFRIPEESSVSPTAEN